MKRILVPIDFSPVTTAVIQKAAQLAQAFRARLWLIHVTTPNPEFVGYEPGPQTVRNQVALRFRKEHRQLQQKARRFQQKGIHATALLVQGPTVETILEEAIRLKADLIVVGSHGYGTWHRVLLGSVSEGLIRKTTRPILVVPARKKGR
jgi:nucleotide-binding universal stress UspA family protein